MCGMGHRLNDILPYRTRERLPTCPSSSHGNASEGAAVSDCSPFASRLNQLILYPLLVGVGALVGSGSGLGVRVRGSGPSDTTMVTVLPTSILVPAVGVCLMT